MSDIFISYAREDRDRAEAIAQALEKLGSTVWFDKKIAPGGKYDEVIQGALDDAKCVIVLWSKASVESDWVKEEADKGKERDRLVPVLIDDVEVPLGFGRLHTANLVHWRGGRTHDEFKELSRSVAQKLGGELDSRRMELVWPPGDDVEPETEAAQQTAEEEAQREAEAERQKAEA
ncbi:MAG: toll/interleukin-1 receptor domain-containing protein, partial [Gammaproteobacteria bacterium]